MKVEIFKKTNLNVLSKAGILNEIGYRGTLTRHGDEMTEFVQEEVTEAKKYTRNKILSDVGGGSKLFLMKDGLLKFQVYIAPRDLSLKAVTDIVKILTKEGKDEMAREDSEQ